MKNSIAELSTRAIDGVCGGATGNNAAVSDERINSVIGTAVGGVAGVFAGLFVIGVVTISPTYYLGDEEATISSLGSPSPKAALRLMLLTAMAGGLVGYRLKS